MLKDSFAHAADDMRARALVEAQVEADQILAATQAALAADGELLTEAERAAMEAELARLSDARAGTDHVALRSAVEAVNQATGEFAQRRMDRNVARALTGKRVDALSQ